VRCRRSAIHPVHGPAEPAGQADDILIVAVGAALYIWRQLSRRDIHPLRQQSGRGQRQRHDAENKPAK
jgi:hypothetical protein